MTQRAYNVPRYMPSDGATWYHYLYGYVPNHQLDFICRPEKASEVSPQQFSHLNRLIQYIEPSGDAAYAFAVCNLSRDDTQHEPGHGGIALILGLRATTLTDHAGRPSPPFTHSIVAVNRQLEKEVLAEAALAFYEHFSGKVGTSANAWFTEAIRSQERVTTTLGPYLQNYSSLPTLHRSDLSLRWTCDDTSPRDLRVLVVCGDDEPFEGRIVMAVRMASVLYCSNAKWTAIFVGQDRRNVDGISLRLVSKSDLSTRSDDDCIFRFDSLDSFDEDEFAQRVGIRRYVPRNIPQDDPQITINDTSDALEMSAQTDDESKDTERPITPENGKDVSRLRSARWRRWLFGLSAFVAIVVPSIWIVIKTTSRPSPVNVNVGAGAAAQATHGTATTAPAAVTSAPVAFEVPHEQMGKSSQCTHRETSAARG